MNNIDYENLTEITVKSQEELDMIPLDFKGVIYIEFGDCFKPAVVNNRYELSVEARGNSSVEAWGNVQVLDCLVGGKIEISGNARIVYNPKNIHEFMNFYDIKHDKKKAVFYKAVHKKDNRYFSNYNNSFLYNIGQEIKIECDTNVNEDCSYGIHISHLDWALNYGAKWHDLAILEVETDIDKIVLPKNSDGKVRTSEITVLREVPLEECGLYGQILANERGIK